MSSTYNQMLEMDTKLLWSILQFFNSRPWLDSKMSRIISKYPWQDIVIILWFLFIIGIIEIGASHLWITSMNMIVSMGKVFQSASR